MLTGSSPLVKTIGICAVAALAAIAAGLLWPRDGHLTPNEIGASCGKLAFTASENL